MLSQINVGKVQLNIAFLFHTQYRVVSCKVYIHFTYIFYHDESHATIVDNFSAYYAFLNTLFLKNPLQQSGSAIDDKKAASRDAGKKTPVRRKIKS